MTAFIAVTTMIVLIAIVYSRLKEQSRNDNINLEKKISREMMGRIAQIEKKTNMIKSTKEPTTIHNSKRIINDNIISLLNLPYLPEEIRKKYTGDFQIELDEVINKKIDELCEYYRNKAIEGTMRKKTVLRIISILENELNEDVLNFDSTKAIIGLYKEDIEENA
jgi:hypothetical protein